MALSVTTDSAGTLGNIQPGWGQDEFATPASPIERAGGTGIVSFSAQDDVEGILVTEANVTATDDALGSVAGVARQATWAGNRISFTQDNKLAQYNATRNMPPMVAASLPGCLDLAGQVLGDPGFSPDSGIYWSLFGHLAGFQPDGSLAEQGQSTVAYEKYNPSTAEFESVSTTTYQNYITASAFTQFDNKCYANGVVGDSFVLAPGVEFLTPGGSDYTRMRLMGKMQLDGEDFIYTFNGMPQGPADGDYALLMAATIDYSAETLTLEITGRAGGTPYTNSDTVSIASLDLDEEMAFRFFYSYRTPGAYIGPYSAYSLSFSVCNTSDYTTVLTADLGGQQSDQAPLWYDPWEIQGNVRAVWERTNWENLDINNDIGWPASEQQDWETARNYAFEGTLTLGQPAIGYSGTVWDWLQDACTVYRWEVGLSGDVVTTRAMGGRVLDVSNHAGVPTVTPSITRTGRSIDVSYSDGSLVSTGEVYDARADNNRILSVNAGQVTETAIQTNAYLTSVLPPTRTTTFIPGEGTYYVIDSTGLPIVAAQWEDYGGAVSVSIDRDEPGVINVLLTGPTEEIPSTTGPYTLAVSDGANEYAALSILGTGIVAEPKILNLLTGADPAKTPVQVGNSIADNAFIATREQAFDTGIWAGIDVNGPKIALDIVVPVGDLDGFGLTVGSLINWRSNTYRVDSAGVGSLNAVISASRFLTVGDFDSAWAGETVGDHDAEWDGYTTSDQRILTYKGTPAAT